MRFGLEKGLLPPSETRRFSDTWEYGAFFGGTFFGFRVWEFCRYTKTETYAFSVEVFAIIYSSAHGFLVALAIRYCD